MINFNERLKQQFTGLKISTPEHTDNLHYLYADYVELVALFSNTAYVTPTDILDRLRDSGEQVINEIIEKEADEDDLQDDIFDTANTSKRNDIKEKWIAEIFAVISDRVKIYGETYPFEYSLQKGLILKQQTTHKNELYIFLLISSNLDSFKKVTSFLTSDFEEISYYALQKLFPSAIVKKFGKRSEYNGTAKTKIRALANDMKLHINEYSLQNVADANVQERGLDVIAWFPFSDNCPNIITILGQCACGKDWKSKYHDTKRFESYMKYFRQKPIHAMFIPYALISKNSDTFFCSDDIEKPSLMLERKRIVDLFDNENEFNNLNSKTIVDECIRYVEDIV